MKSSNIHLPGLNGLRFISAMMVVISHIELMKMAFGYKHYWTHPLFFYFGGIGVYFFFTLSGFLITYLLLKEKETTQTISISKFYVRRILRIWPLYYLVTLIGFFILPLFPEIKITYLDKNFHENYYAMLVLYILMLPNISASIYGHVPHIGHLWTIGVEEQFYLIWPWVVKQIKKLNLFIPLFILFVVIVKSITLYFFLHNKDIFPQIKYIKEFFAGFKIECMAIGAYAALLITQKHNLIKFLFHPLAHIFSWLLIPVLIFFTPAPLQDANHLLYSLAFIVIIINVSFNEKSFLKLENYFLDLLGKISYGIYMYHFMLIPIVIYFFKIHSININNAFGNFLLYFISIFLSVIISYLSYIYFEKPFLKYKDKYSVIMSKM